MKYSGIAVGGPLDGNHIESDMQNSYKAYTPENGVVYKFVFIEDEVRVGFWVLRATYDGIEPYVESMWNSAALWCALRTLSDRYVEVTE